MSSSRLWQATALPLQAQKGEFSTPFAAWGGTQQLLYFGESVLLADFRGPRIGHSFFAAREAAAREQGAPAATFAVVVRLDPFWRVRGYAPVEGLVIERARKDHREAEKSAKPMQYWLRRF
ncbi:hypothetical protein [Novosphingobium sp. BW1]|uniref:hypothetical protein n=1 Tax=Novosphingobium sp. BW1 TaxID=2592621 RepID=UPI001F08568B|nr:hypothetical protein [Novosphingobium sp. BW1]